MANSDDPKKTIVPAASAPFDVNQLELFKEFLKLQGDEISLKKQRFEIDRQEQSNSHEIAKLSIDAQIRDRQAQRVYKSKSATKTYFFIATIIVLFLAFAVFALYEGKESVVKEIVNTVVIAVGGVAGGYAFCLRKMIGKNPQINSIEDDE
jgi:hypothetical protein